MSRDTSRIQNNDEIDRQIIEKQKIGLMISFDVFELELKKKNRQLYYENQEVTATQVANVILREPKVVFQLVKAMTQTGKTGCMSAVIKLCFTLDNCDTTINPKNIFIITGISSTEWCDQMSDRFPSELRQNIYHRNKLHKLQDLKRKLQDVNDAIIIMDEVHIAAKENMTIDKLLKSTGFKDMNILRERNINFIEFSATPNKVMEDMDKWKEYAKQHIMSPGNGYKGVEHQLENNRAFQAKDLYIADDPSSSMTKEERDKRNKEILPARQAIKSLKEKIKSFYTSPKYHIVRLPGGDKFNTVKQRFHQIFTEDFEHIACHSSSEDADIQRIIKDIPSKHTIIYIKDGLRCAVTLEYKENMGILYERIAKTINDDVMIQGLAGRATGYDVPNHVLVYTNITSLKRYVDVWRSGFTCLGDFTYAGKRSRNTKPTFIHPTGYTNTGVVVQENTSKKDDDWNIETEEFNCIEKANTYLKKNGFNKRSIKENKDGFIESSTTGSKMVIQYSKFQNDIKNWGKGSNLALKQGQEKASRLYVVYRDIKDKTTAVFVVRIVKRKYK